MPDLEGELFGLSHSARASDISSMAQRLLLAYPLLLNLDASQRPL